MTQSHQCQNGFFVNLHAPYKLIFVRVQEYEYTFDQSGRMLWLMYDDEKIERNLNNKFVKKWDLDNDFIYRHSRVLKDNEVCDVIEQLRKKIQTITNKLHSKPHCGKQCNVFQHQDEITTFLKKVLSWTHQNLHDDSIKYAGIYSPVEIFPTDVPHPLIIQFTQGCAYNKCTFCGFYKDKPFSTKTLKDLECHLQSVKTFLGSSLINMKNIFLADANALMIDQQLLIEMFDCLGKEFDFQSNYVNENHFFTTSPPDSSAKFEGIYSFIDALYGKKKTVEDFIQLKKRHLKKVYIGLETGSDDLLKFVHKCNQAQDVIDMVAVIKEAGLKVGIMVMAGLGGDTFSDEHIRDTVDVINRMEIDGNDSIHFSHLASFDNTSYQDDADKADIKRLSQAEEDEQIEKMIQQFTFRRYGYPQIKGYEVKHVRF